MEAGWSWECRRWPWLLLAQGPRECVEKAGAWRNTDEWGIRIEQVFVSRGCEEMEERDFAGEYRRLHAMNFPPVPGISIAEFIRLFPAFLRQSSPGVNQRPRLCLCQDRKVGLLAQEILYLFLKFPSVTFSRVKFGTAFEQAFGRLLDASEAVGSYGGLLEWREGAGSRRLELGLKEEVAWSLRVRYLLLYEDKPMPISSLVRAYKCKYGEDLSGTLGRLGLTSVEALVARHPHVLSSSPAGVVINPIFLASLGRLKQDIIFPRTSLPLISPPNNAALRRRPPMVSVSASTPPSPPPPTLSGDEIRAWMERNPLAHSLCLLLGLDHPFSAASQPIRLFPPSSTHRLLSSSNPPAKSELMGNSAYLSAQKTLQSSLPSTLSEVKSPFTCFT